MTIILKIDITVKCSKIIKSIGVLNVYYCVFNIIYFNCKVL